MPAKKLTRSRDDRWIAGVCGGIAEFTGIDTTVVRVIIAIATLLGAGSLVVIYLACWLLIPREPATALSPEPPSSSSH
jgi:phage shock protein PspC (stress-responsive transcriptional regulator)